MASPTLRRLHIKSHFQKHETTQSNHKLDMDIFSPENLITEQGIHEALVALDRSWWQEELEPLELTLRELMADSHSLLAYIVAIALDESRFHHLLLVLHRTFPATANAFLSSLASDLVKYMRDFYIRFVSPEVPRSLDDCHRAVIPKLNVLRALSDLKLELDVPTPASPTDEIETKYRQSQRKKKQMKHQSSSSPTTNATPFLAIGERVPRTMEEAANLAHAMLEDQEEILKEYLRVLRLPALAPAVKDMYTLSQLQSSVECVSPQNVTLKESSNPTPITPISTEIPLAYPQIQPLKAARYFAEPAEGFGSWKLLVSTRAIQHLRTYHRDNSNWPIIEKKMQELSAGFFSDSNQKKLSGGGQGIPIYEAKLTKDLRIIYQIDLAPDDATGNDQQVIRIWGIHTHAQMDKRLWKSIIYHQSRVGGEYRRRCLRRETVKQPGNNFIMPALWSDIIEKLPTEDVLRNRNITTNTEEQLELHSVLALEKFTRMSQALMNSIAAGQNDTYAFELAGPEQKICDHPSSCFVLGRSGTGKTTTMVFKIIAREMLNIQQAAEAVGPPATKYLQLFVTQSRILARRVQEYFCKALMSQSAGQMTSQEIERLALRNRPERDDEMFDIDEDEDERSDLPKKFSELKDSHYPLFLTVDQLYKLLEADFNLSFKRRPRTKKHSHAEQQSWSVEADVDMVAVDDDDLTKDDGIANMSISSDRRAETESVISFETFLYTYWPHFPQALTKGLDPVLVWSELIGVIKGSEESLQAETEPDFMDKERYLNLSHRRQPTFVNQRERVYSLFECYTKLKRSQGDYDAADRTHAILKALEAGFPGGRKVDFLYVDEAQDNLIVDARLLRQVCSNTHGMFWAGDTAQTISMGSSFRFSDLKSILYRLEEKSCGSRTLVHPDTFQLAINYRSHAGIVNCAQSVVDLISQFWPDSIDNLAREQGVVDGPHPVFLCGWDLRAARYEQFLFHETGNIEFGAQQCIIVRDERAREDLRREIGDVGLILTLYESKGLEFNDVLLYNFFSDSTAKLADWRVVLNAVEESKRGNVGVPRFDELRHSSLCLELKSLYVGITRARCHVWILDIPNNGEEKGEPMHMFWNSRDLVQTCRPGDSVPKLAVRSTQEQWAQQGHALFMSKHFQLAVDCFKRAGLPRERWISHAYLLRRTAQQIPLGSGSKKSAAYIQAAEAFVVCAGLSDDPARSKYFSLGADCFATSGAHASAAQAYLRAAKFTKAAQQFRIAKLFDEVANVVLSHQESVDEQCIAVAKLHLHREHQIRKASCLFKSLDEQLSHLEEYGFDMARTAFLETLGRWKDAAEIHDAEGRSLEAISLWIRAGDPDSRLRAEIGLLDSLWSTLPIGKEPHEQRDSRLLELLHKPRVELMDEMHRDESAMFLAIFAKDITGLLSLAREFHKGNRKNSMAALLCYDHALAKPSQMYRGNGQSVAKFLEDYDSYAQLMHKVILDSHKIHEGQWPEAAKLLGLAEKHDNATAGAPAELRVLPSSILYGNLKGSEFQSSEDGISVTSDRLSKSIREVLGERLRERLREEHTICLRCKSFQPCLNYALSGNCGRPECSREHLPRDSLGIEAFNLRTRLHVKQVLIVQSMEILRYKSDHRALKWIWQGRLYETLFPFFYAFGHVCILNGPRHSGSLPTPWISSNPEHHRASRVLSDWLCDSFYSLKPFKDNDRFVTDVIQTAMLMFTINQDAACYLCKAPCVVKEVYRHPRLHRKEGYVIHDLLDFLEGSSKISLPSGIQFIKHVLENRIPIDVNTLLHVLEAVVRRTIMASCPTLDRQVTLPRSWIVDMVYRWDKIHDDSNAPINQFQLLFKPLKELLEGVWLNKDVSHLMHEGRSLETVHPHSQIRTVTIFRICKSLALLGYNIFHLKLRDDIGNTLACLGRIGGIFPHLILPYVKAEQWNDIARAVRMSTDSPLDELILLWKANKSPNLFVHREVRPVKFDTISDVTPVLDYMTASKFNPEAKPFVPSSAAQICAPLTDLEPPVDDPAPEEPFGDENGVMEVTAPNDLAVERTEAEISAATKIQKWYRRKMTLRTPEASEVTRLRLHFYASSRAEIEKIRVPPSYRRLFLGPLPHVLTALHGCGKVLLSTKRLLKKSLSREGPLDYDYVGDTFTLCNSLDKTRKSIWNHLEPCSNVHHEGSVDKLRQRVDDARELVRSTLTVSQSMKKYMLDMDIGYKGIVLPSLSRPTPKALKRPTLNTEDID